MILAEGDVYALTERWKLFITQQVHTSDAFKKIIVRASGPSKLASDKWGTIGQSHNFLCDSAKIDRYGAIVGFGAHVPLFLKVHTLSSEGAKDHHAPHTRGASGSGGWSGGGWAGNDGSGNSWSGGGWSGNSCGKEARASGPGTKRQRSDVGRELRANKYQKHIEYTRTGTWPWHLAYHPSEATYYAPKNYKQGGKLHQGGGYDGVAWRLTRNYYIQNGFQQELDEYEKA